jgi:hypothetical protein
MGCTSQTQHKPICESKENIKLLKLHTLSPCTRGVSQLKSSLERSNAPYGTNIRKINFPTQTTVDGVAVS